RRHRNGTTASAGNRASCLVSTASVHSTAAVTAPRKERVKRATARPASSSARKRESTRARSNHAPPTRKLAAKKQAAMAPAQRSLVSRTTHAAITAKAASDDTNETNRSGK